MASESRLPPQTIRRLQALRDTGRFTALVPFGSYRTDKHTAKAWILPDGRPIAIDRWHYEWILANRDLAASFGIDLEGIPLEETPVRVAAVRAGFFRLNYQIRDGQLTVEGLASRLTAALREALFVVLVENLEQLGAVHIHLFDDHVLSVAQRVALPLATLEDPRRQLAAVEQFCGLVPVG